MKGRFIIQANYKKLWHILLDRNMKKKELAELAGAVHAQSIRLIKMRMLLWKSLGRYAMY